MGNSEALVGIVANDAGGAEILAAYLAGSGEKAIFSLSGPAVRVFQRWFGPVVSLEISELVSEAAWILTGTGWQTDCEWNAIQRGLLSGKRVVTFLDGWVNYLPRFRRGTVELRPDEIWVADPKAQKLAFESFPNIQIRLVEVPKLFAHHAERYSVETIKHGQPALGSLLFLSDNTVGPLSTFHSIPLLYSDAASLRFLIENLSFINGAKFPITIRPHPSEKLSDWDWAIEAFGSKVRVSIQQDLIKDFVSHEFVAGSDSVALLHALNCGKKVFCAIPPFGCSPSIPTGGLVFIRDFPPYSRDLRG